MVARRGTFRISLTYEAPTGRGQKTARTDTYHGRFEKLGRRSGRVRTLDPTLRSEMTTTITLTDAEGGTDLLAMRDGLPPGLSPADNETGWRMALEKLGALVEEG